MSSKMSIGLIVATLLLSIGLVACGDTATSAVTTTNTASAASTTSVAGGGSNTTAAGKASTTSASSGGATSGNVPVPTGASSVTLPDAMKQGVAQYASSVPGGSFTAYKFGGASDKAQAAVSDSFKKDGWTDNSATMGAAASAMQQQGMFISLYQKGTQVAEVIGYPSQVASALGASVGSNESFYIVVAGGN